jgi:hypothetical protein
MSYPLKKLESLSTKIQELLGSYYIESRTDLILKPREGVSREEEFYKSIKRSNDASSRFMAKAGIEVLPQIQSTLAEIEALLSSEDKSFITRIQPILEKARSIATYPVNPLRYNELSSILMSLKGHLSIRALIRPNIFIGYRYTPEDEEIANKFMTLFTFEGMNLISAKTAKTEDVGEKVKRLIGDSEGVIIIATRDQELKDGGWTTSVWLTDEKSFALGQSKKVGLFFEDCISPTSKKGIQGDLEYIEFNREHLDKAFLEATPYLRDLRQSIIESRI